MADAYLIEDMGEIKEQLGWAERRLDAHIEREFERKKSGLKTDMERWLNGEAIVD